MPAERRANERDRTTLTHSQLYPSETGTPTSGHRCKRQQAKRKGEALTVRIRYKALKQKELKDFNSALPVPLLQLLLQLRSSLALAGDEHDGRYLLLKDQLQDQAVIRQSTRNRFRHNGGERAGGEGKKIETTRRTRGAKGDRRARPAKGNACEWLGTRRKAMRYAAHAHCARRAYWRRRARAQ
eukprot:5027684-Pleurochrysis_carterae.AAC.1